MGGLIKFVSFILAAPATAVLRAGDKLGDPLPFRHLGSKGNVITRRGLGISEISVEQNHSYPHPNLIIGLATEYLVLRL